MFAPILFHDILHNRVDIRPVLANVLIIALTLIFAAFLPNNIGIAHVFTLILFVLGMRALLWVLGTSNIASTVVAVAAVLLVAPLSQEQLLAVITYVAVFIVMFEFLKNTNLHVGLALGSITGLLAALQGKYGAAMVGLIVVIISSYILWRLVFSRPSKKVFVKMIVKTGISSLLAIGGYIVIVPLLRGPLSSLGLPVEPSIHPILGFVLVATCLYGLWVTLLLKTAKSPWYRGQRLFLFATTLCVISLPWVVHNLIFPLLSPMFIFTLTNMGLFYWSLPLFCVALCMAALFASAALDRPLFKPFIPSIKQRG